MNKRRRKTLAHIHEQLEKMAEELERVRDEEEAAFDNLPENLQDSEFGQTMQASIGFIEDAVAEIENASLQIAEVMGEAPV